MKKLTIICALLVIASLFSCERKEAKIDPSPTGIDSNATNSTHSKRVDGFDSSENELIKRAVNDGDCDAFDKIASKCIYNMRYNDIYYFAQKVAFKYKCPNAFYTLYRVLNSGMNIDGVSYSADDEIHKVLTLYYLFKASELGSEYARSTVESRFTDSSRVPGSEVYLKKVYDNLLMLEK